MNETLNNALTAYVLNTLLGVCALIQTIMKPMSELKGFNMERILLKNKNGYFCFGYYKDGMIEVDGEWSHPSTWKEWCSIAELKYALEVS